MKISTSDQTDSEDKYIVMKRSHLDIKTYTYLKILLPLTFEFPTWLVFTFKTLLISIMINNIPQTEI